MIVLDPVLGVGPASSTLAEIERDVASRIGPFEQRICGAGATTKQIYVGKLVSSLQLGGLENRYVLRRGLMSDGTAIGGFNADDRQRIIVTYTSEDGLLEVDRDYHNATIDGEAIEIHYLDPEQELRPLVVATLKGQVKVAERTSIALANLIPMQDITSFIPYVTKLDQVWELEHTYPSAIVPPRLVPWWQPFMQAGHVWVHIAPSPYPNAMIVTHWFHPGLWFRPLGATAPSLNLAGPSNDSDVLACTAAYAAAAAHERGWLQGNVRPRIMDAARDGLYIDQRTTIQVYEKEARNNFSVPPRRLMFPAPDLGPDLVINGPTVFR